MYELSNNNFNENSGCGLIEILSISYDPVIIFAHSRHLQRLIYANAKCKYKITANVSILAIWSFLDFFPAEILHLHQVIAIFIANFRYFWEILVLNSTKLEEKQELRLSNFGEISKPEAKK